MSSLYKISRYIFIHCLLGITLLICDFFLLNKANRCKKLYVSVSNFWTILFVGRNMYNVIRIMFDRAGSFDHFEITTVYHIFPSGFIYTSAL